MKIPLAALALGQAREAMRRAAIQTALALAAGAFVVIAVVGLFVALFFALEPPLGPLRAALALSGVALCLALLFSAPLWARRRRRPPPPPAPTLAQFVSQLARDTPALSPRQAALGAVLLALALGLMVGRSEKPKP